MGDADRICKPVAGTLARATWMARPAAQLLMSMYEANGEPCTADPRRVLARAIERLRERGFNPVMAAEIEFYLLSRDERGA